MTPTKIEWVKNPDNITQGITVNSKTGCLNHNNGMCRGGDFPCYAYKLAWGRLKTRYLANDNFRCYKEKYDPMQLRDIAFWGKDPFYPRWWPEKLDKIRKRKKPTGIFLDDMSDWMGDYWPKEWTQAELQAMRDCPQHRFYTLTKQPQNLVKYSPFPENCWMGVTVTNTRMFIPALNWLDEIDAKIKYVSFEPLLGQIPLNYKALQMAGIKWVILGSQTKPYKPPKIEWVQEIIKAADKANIPVFLKNNLAILLRQNNYNIYSFPEWAGEQFAVTGDCSLAPTNPHPNEVMRKLKQEMPQ